MSVNWTKSITSEKRLEEMLAEAERELEKVQPQIEKLERQMDKLKQLKLTKQKLITLKLSIQSILENFAKSATQTDLSSFSALSGLSDSGGFLPLPIRYTASQAGTSASRLHEDPPGIFLPDRAFQEVSRVLRRKTSLNYELFRAIVFNGGRASTEQIKTYLVENEILQPATGKGFETVELTDISSRVNYLVRKGVVAADGHGWFISVVGWVHQEVG